MLGNLEHIGELEYGVLHARLSGTHLAPLRLSRLLLRRKPRLVPTNQRRKVSTIPRVRVPQDIWLARRSRRLAIRPALDEVSQRKLVVVLAYDTASCLFDSGYRRFGRSGNDDVDRRRKVHSSVA